MSAPNAPKLEGKLSPKALGEVLKKLEGNRGAAYLLVSDGLSERCLYFSVGAIRLSSMGKRRGLSLEEALKTHTRVQTAMVQAAKTKQEKTSHPFEEIIALAY